MAEVVGDYDDDPIPPRPRSDDEYSPFDVDDEASQPQQASQQNENEAQQSPEDEQQRLSRIETNTSTSSRPREATELDEIRRLSTESTSDGSISSGEYRIASNTGATTTSSTSAANSQERRNRKKREKWIPGPVRRFWARNITLEVPHKGNRDYFALERTFLAYMRTSATFSIQGVLVAQLFRLQPSHPYLLTLSRINFRSIGIPLSIAYQICAIVTALLGAYRFWRQQNAIARGKVLCGGWELTGIGIMTFLAAVTLLALALAIIIESR
ncbi:hypothetical protein EYB25_006159 [Talaromyces marneffei]|uniref:uncharacterized protein n=1 Tax=Talaromyces marneffei TaxID=37727 RepID=UPI0012A949E7|nr:uncharacterized protein EYB26_006550 [Talaromyces marneffei]KAE8552265.1 hypothetical protein EYB25_006159 [Talaromyces marneffei]QGA18865.1 hypothetical protein EYB26_006550 [Talaromyces marneffei]